MRPRGAPPLLTFVVAGGGFAGVETIASINDFLRDALPFYPNLKEEMLRIVLVHPGEFILPELGGKLGRYADKKVRARGVEIFSKSKVAAVRPCEIELNNGEKIVSSTLVWTAGTSPNPILDLVACPKERGRIKVNAHLEVEGCDGLWALGDCALVPDPATGDYCPPTAQHASREGKVLAHNIIASINGKPKKPFKFKTLGLLAAIGRRTGVARILGVNFSGFIAWFLWRGIYWSKLPRMEKKVRVAIDWTLDVFSRRISFSISINARWPHRKLKPARRRGIATNFPIQPKATIASLHEEPIGVRERSKTSPTRRATRMTSTP